jgi:hypothetical protein
MPSQNIPIRLFKVEKTEVDRGSSVSSSMASSTFSEIAGSMAESKSLLTESMMGSRIETLQEAPAVPVEIKTEQQQP